MKTDKEIWPILRSALMYIHTSGESAESIDACRHLFMNAWLQMGEDYGKLVPGPSNPMTHAPTGATISIDMEEKLQSIEAFLSLRNFKEQPESASS